MSTEKVVLLGCGIAVLIAVMVTGALVGFFLYMSQDLEGVSVSITSPLDVKVGETFEMVVNVKNQREKRDLSLSDIDISENYLASFAIISTDPTPKASMHVPVDFDMSSMSYTFDMPIPAGAMEMFTFTLRAEKAGVFRGDVDVYEGSRFVTALAQTVVKD